MSRVANCLQDQRKMLKEEVDDEDVAEVVSRWTGIPVSRMLESEREKLVGMEERLGKTGSSARKEAIEAVANAVRRARSGIQDPNRPMGSFIFHGTPPVWAKPNWPRPWPSSSLTTNRPWCASTCPNTWKNTPWARLIGAPPGYVGYEEGGYLTEAVRRRPYSVILFDEIEKAHPDVFNVLLQILDERPHDRRSRQDR